MLSPKDIFDEIDAEPKPLRKWLFTHADSINVFATIISIAVPVAIAVIK